MRIAAITCLILSIVMLAIPAMAANSPQEAAIKARQGHMDIRAFNLGPMIGMLKGDIPYDADQAEMLAGNLEALLDMDIRRIWMKGTSTDDFPDKTNALPAIWAPDSEVMSREDDYEQAVHELVQVAGDGMKAMAPKVKDLAQTCKGCHDDYRKKK